MTDLNHYRPLIAPALGAFSAGYLLGSLPFGFLVARARGVNIFAAGSKSSGATNVRRVLGAKCGNTVFALDVLKGAAAAGWPLLFAWWRGRGQEVNVQESLHYVGLLLGAIGLIGAILGHSFSCFVGFRGGKGVATGAGGFLVLMPIVTLIGAGVWLAFFFLIGFVSLASIAAAATLPIAACFLHRPLLLILIAAAVAIFVIFTHRANIRRIVAGTERRRGRKYDSDS
ncbi:MAG TPA: glycerol-3-phosphate 1-O-acyltransferase PlsY [Opitutaceae bacterium]|jgi:glycerol-3-phosphate acyltransferase PlsY